MSQKSGASVVSSGGIVRAGSQDVAFKHISEDMILFLSQKPLENGRFLFCSVLAKEQ